VAFFAAICISWLLSVDYTLWVHHVDVGERAISAILGLYHEPLQGELTRVLGAAGGPIITIWFDLQFILIFIGSTYAFLRYVRRGKELIVPTGGLLIIAFVGLSFLAPAVTKGLSPQRWIDFGYIFFAGCIALLFLRLWSNSKLRSLVLLFLVVSPSMNMLLPSQVQATMVLFHPENQIPLTQVALQAPMHAQDFRLAEFITAGVPQDDPVSTDNVGVFPLNVANHMSNEAKQPYFGTKYLLVSRFLYEDGIWVSYDEAYQRFANNVGVVASARLLDHGNVIYHNAEFMLLETE
jgi:hypothetical protein